MRGIEWAFGTTVHYLYFREKPHLRSVSGLDFQIALNPIR